MLEPLKFDCIRVCYFADSNLIFQASDISGAQLFALLQLHEVTNQVFVKSLSTFTFKIGVHAVSGKNERSFCSFSAKMAVCAKCAFENVNPCKLHP